MAAPANSTIGRPDRMPTWVSDRCRSSWISGMTGGTARMVSRSATPASQSRASARSGDHQMARRCGTLSTAPIASSVKTTIPMKTPRGAPWSSSAAEHQRRKNAGDVIAGGDESEHPAERAGRGDLAHDQVARRHHQAAGEAGDRHHQHEQDRAEVEAADQQRRDRGCTPNPAPRSGDGASGVRRCSRRSARRPRSAAGCR